jgi:hypothetical protein
VWHMTHQFYPPDLIILTMFRGEYKPWSSTVCHFLQPPFISSLIGPNIFNTLLLNNLILEVCSSVNVTYQVSHPYKTTGKILNNNYKIWTSVSFRFC